jgi:uncharacterized integral membrane protein
MHLEVNLIGQCTTVFVTLNRRLRMDKTKIVFACVLLFLFIFILQNLKSVQTMILFFKIEMPLVVLLLFTLGIGFILGVIYMKRKDKSSQQI